MTRPARSFDTTTLRRALGALVTGVTVVTTLDAHGKEVGTPPQPLESAA